MTSSALKCRAREAREWMVSNCFPLWGQEGTGGHGLFRENLDPVVRKKLQEGHHTSKDDISTMISQLL